MPAHPDPTFHASAKLAMHAPPEKLAYTVMLSPDFSQPDALAIVDLDPGSKSLGKIVPHSDHAQQGRRVSPFWLERLLIGVVSACRPRLPGAALPDHPGHSILAHLRDRHQARSDQGEEIHKIIEPEEVLAKTGYSRPHTIHCGPEGIYVSTLGGGGPNGTNGPPGIFIMDCETFDVIGRYELDRGLQDKHYDFWWNLPRDYMVSSEWGLPPQFENGVVPGDLVSNKYGHRLHFWNLRERRNVQTIDLGANHQMPLEVRPCPMTRSRNTVSPGWSQTARISKARSGHGGGRAARSIARRRPPFHPEPAKKDQLPPLLQGFEAVPPLVTDIDLSLDDRFLYVSCWGTGELRQYDVSDPMNPKLSGSVHIGGVTRKTPSSWRPRLLRRSANGRDQSRRQTRVLDQLALLDLGQPVLSGRRSGRDGQGRCRRRRRHHAGQDLLCRVPGRIPLPPDPP